MGAIQCRRSCLAAVNLRCSLNAAQCTTTSSSTAAVQLTVLIRQHVVQVDSQQEVDHKLEEQHPEDCRGSGWRV